MSASIEAGAPARYSGVAILLHWVIALGILCLVCLGLYMVHATIPRHLRFQLFQLHKSIGVTVLLAVVLRVLWRAGHRPPALPATLSPLERRAAEGTHWTLYALMLGLPLTGWMLVSVSPFNLPTVLYGLVPWPHLPILSTLEDKAPVEKVFIAIHTYLAWFLIAVVALHAAAAFRHHFVLRDDVLRRMLPAGLLLALVVATPAAASDWTVDPAKSRLGFSGSATGAAFDGRFAKFDAKIDFDPAKPEAGHALVSIDMASATTGDIQKDQALPQPDWFDVKKFPQATFEAQHFTAKGNGAYEAAGTLTIRGMTQPATLPFTLAIDGDTAHAKGHVTILRTAFGVGQGSWSSSEYVAFEVDVDVDYRGAPRGALSRLRAARSTG